MAGSTHSPSMKVCGVSEPSDLQLSRSMDACRRCDNCLCWLWAWRKGWMRATNDEAEDEDDDEEDTFMMVCRTGSRWPPTLSWFRHITNILQQSHTSTCDNNDTLITTMTCFACITNLQPGHKYTWYNDIFHTSSKQWLISHKSQHTFQILAYENTSCYTNDTFHPCYNDDTHVTTITYFMLQWHTSHTATMTHFTRVATVTLHMLQQRHMTQQ